MSLLTKGCGGGGVKIIYLSPAKIDYTYTRLDSYKAELIPQGIISYKAELIPQGIISYKAELIYQIPELTV